MDDVTDKDIILVAEFAGFGKVKRCGWPQDFRIKGRRDEDFVPPFWCFLDDWQRHVWPKLLEQPEDVHAIFFHSLTDGRGQKAVHWIHATAAERTVALARTLDKGGRK